MADTADMAAMAVAGCMPYTDPLPLQSYDQSHYSPLHVPDKVRTHGDLPSKYSSDKQDKGGLGSRDNSLSNSNQGKTSVKGKDTSIKATSTPKATAKSTTPSTKNNGLSTPKPIASKTSYQTNGDR